MRPAPDHAGLGAPAFHPPDEWRPSVSECERRLRSLALNDETALATLLVAQLDPDEESAWTAGRVPSSVWGLSSLPARPP
jgi:hypothetical protein